MRVTDAKRPYYQCPHCNATIGSILWAKIHKLRCHERRFRYDLIRIMGRKAVRLTDPERRADG